MRQRGFWMDFPVLYHNKMWVWKKKNDFLFTFLCLGRMKEQRKSQSLLMIFFPTMDADRPKKFGCQSLFTLFLIKQFPFQLLGTCEKLEVIFHTAVATKKLTMINWIEVLEKILLLNLNRIFSWVLFHYRVRLWWSVISVNISRTAFYGFLIRDSFFALKNTGPLFATPKSHLQVCNLIVNFLLLILVNERLCKVQID